MGPRLIVMSHDYRELLSNGLQNDPTFFYWYLIQLLEKSSLFISSLKLNLEDLFFSP